MKVIAEDEIWCDFFYTELTTGLRRGEICGLKWEDFDEASGTLKICRTVYREDGGGLTAGDTRTSAGTRKIVLSSSTAQVLCERKRSALTEWIFPSPLRPEQPADPGSAYRRPKVLLRRAGPSGIRFHDIRHTFATLSLKNGMDAETLSVMLGHVSAAPTLDVYTHVTDTMQTEAAARIDCGLGNEMEEADPAEEPAMTDFRPASGRIRRPGTGCITEINDHLFEGRYSPTWPGGKRHAQNVYAQTRTECEKKLEALVREMVGYE